MNVLSFPVATVVPGQEGMYLDGEHIKYEKEQLEQCLVYLES